MTTTRDVHVGAPKADFDFPLEDSVNVHFHDFANLSTDNNASVLSPVFTCAGYDWTLMLYPGGTRASKRGMVAFVLINESESSVVVGCDVSIIKKNGRKYNKMTMATSSISSILDSDADMQSTFRGHPDFVNRENVLDPSNRILNNGTLTFNIRIRLHADFYCSTIQPQSSISESLRRFFLEEESADVGLVVSGEVAYAHKLVLKMQAPHFAELTEQFDKDYHMTIEDVDPESFFLMLRHIYGKNILADEWKEHSKEILEASDKYGFTALKLEADAWHSKVHNFTVDNAVDELLYADAKNCTHLKKAAMKFIVDNGNDIIASTSYERLDESPRLRKEVMQEFAKSNESRKRKRDE